MGDGSIMIKRDGADAEDPSSDNAEASTEAAFRDGRQLLLGVTGKKNQMRIGCLLSGCFMPMAVLFAFGVGVALETFDVRLTRAQNEGLDLFLCTAIPLAILLSIAGMIHFGSGWRRWYSYMGTIDRLLRGFGRPSGDGMRAEDQLAALVKRYPEFKTLPVVVHESTFKVPATGSPARHATLSGWRPTATPKARPATANQGPFVQPRSYTSLRRLMLPSIFVVFMGWLFLCERFFRHIGVIPAPAEHHTVPMALLMGVVSIVLLALGAVLGFLAYSMVLAPWLERTWFLGEEALRISFEDRELATIRYEEIQLVQGMSGFNYNDRSRLVGWHMVVVHTEEHLYKLSAGAPAVGLYRDLEARCPNALCIPAYGAIRPPIEGIDPRPALRRAIGSCYRLAVRSGTLGAAQGLCLALLGLILFLTLDMESKEPAPLTRLLMTMAIPLGVGTISAFFVALRMLCLGLSLRFHSRALPPAEDE